MSKSRSAGTVLLVFLGVLGLGVYLLAQSSGGNKGVTFPLVSGISTSPQYSFPSGWGIGDDSAIFGPGSLVIYGAPNTRALAFNGGPNIPAATCYKWAGNINSNASTNLGLCDGGTGILQVGSGSGGNTAAVVQAAGLISAGTTFSASGCTNGTLVGGATAGKFTVGQGTVCTIVITMGNTATAPNGWDCAANDLTNVPAVAIRQVLPISTTQASLLMTVTSSDQVSFHCTGY